MRAARNEPLSVPPVTSAPGDKLGIGRRSADHQMKPRRPLRPATLLLTACVIGVGSGGAAWVAGRYRLADVLWAGTAILALVPIVAALVRSLLKRLAGVDVIALLAIVGALVLREYLAGAVIGLMIATGRALEDYAANRAERELSSLLSRAPRVAHRLEDGAVNTVSVEQVPDDCCVFLRQRDLSTADHNFVFVVRVHHRRLGSEFRSAGYRWISLHDRIRRV